MDFLVRQWWIRRTRKSIVRLKQQAAKSFGEGTSWNESLDDFRYSKNALPRWHETLTRHMPHPLHSSTKRLFPCGLVGVAFLTVTALLLPFL
ncbi:hypothetical protein Rcae01_03420 [Novipirellula caenicola]|uniref:Uncharacterized protein n=1 Tax=Novipirellula caenicola TaxID=1536901 RepID=A0ABP9VS34_9BACT